MPETPCIHSTFDFYGIPLCVDVCISVSIWCFLYCFFGSFSHVCFVLFQFLKILLYCIVFWINFLVVLSEVVFCCPILALHLHLYDPVWCLKLGMRVAGVKEAEHQERSSPWKPLLRVWPAWEVRGWTSLCSHISLWVTFSLPYSF